MTNSVDPNQTSDLGLHCLQGLSVPILKVIRIVRDIVVYVYFQVVKLCHTIQE